MSQCNNGLVVKQRLEGRITNSPLDACELTCTLKSTKKATIKPTEGIYGNKFV